MISSCSFLFFTESLCSFFSFDLHLHLLNLEYLFVIFFVKSCVESELLATMLTTYHIQKYCYSDKIRELIFSFDFSRPLLGVPERTNTPQLSTRHLLKRRTRYERRERWRSRHVHGEYSLYLAYI